MNLVYSTLINLIYRVWRKSHPSDEDERNWQHAIDSGDFSQVFGLAADLLLFVTATLAFAILIFRDIAKRRSKNV